MPGRRWAASERRRVAARTSNEEVYDVYALSDDESVPRVVDLTGDSDDMAADDGMDDVPITVSATDDDMDDVDGMDDVDVDHDGMDDVDIEHNAYTDLYNTEPTPPPTSATPLEVVVGTSAPTPKKRTSQWTPRDRKNRVLAHQLHVLTILAAARRRNGWCNDATLREQLQGTVPDLLLHKLAAIHPKHEPERRERVRLFEAFMMDLVLWWGSRFRLHASECAEYAWRQPNQDLVVGKPVAPHTWIDGWVTETAEERAARSKKRGKAPLAIALFPPGASTSTPTYLRLLPSHAVASAADLCAAAKARVGTRETSAMLFCALCRALGVPARLVVSVQAPPFSVTPAKVAPKKADTSAVALDDEPPVRLRSHRTGRRDDDAPYYIEPIDTRSPPTLWVEVFSKPYQHWITVDPIRCLVRVTGNKHMEPLPTNKQNRLVYVVGFEEDGYARDVTPRYTRVLHTKIARARPAAVGRATVPTTMAPDAWWSSVVRALQRPQRLDRDAAEDVELADATAREPMPSSLGGFKDHPVYCVEHFLRREQVVHPPHRVGTFQGQPVYLRSNVLTLQSARQWYNQGRVVNDDEQPLKFVKARGYSLMNRRMEEQAKAEGRDEMQVGLYSYAQTHVYVPPPIQGGYVPTNAFGNIDLFVPSMLPAGGVHIAHPRAAKAAKRLQLSYAEAVVGFEFRKQRSLPRMVGAVVAAEHADAVWEAIRADEKAAEETEHARRQARAIKGWRKLLTALTVAKHVQDQYGTARAERGPLPDAPPQLRAALARPADEPRQLHTLPATQPTPDDVPTATPVARTDLPIVSLDELMAAEARGDAPAPPRRRIVLKRAAEVPERRRKRRAASAAAEAMQAYSGDESS